MDRRRVQEQWGRQADAYATSPLHRGTPDLLRMVEMVRPRGHELVLDLATGGGHTARVFAPHVAQVVACDMTRRMLENARRLALEEDMEDMEFVQGEVSALPFRDAYFDLVTVRAATHHFPDIREALREINRVLRPGGRLIVNDSVVPEDPEVDRFINAAEVLRDPTHVKSYSRSEWEEHLQAVGFHLAEVELWRKTHDFHLWMDLAGMGEGEKRRLENHFLAAPVHIKDFLQVDVREGSVASFADLKAIFLVQRTTESD